MNEGSIMNDLWVLTHDRNTRTAVVLNIRDDRSYVPSQHLNGTTFEGMECPGEHRQKL